MAKDFMVLGAFSSQQCEPWRINTIETALRARNEETSIREIVDKINDMIISRLHCVNAEQSGLHIPSFEAVDESFSKYLSACIFPFVKKLEPHSIRAFSMDNAPVKQGLNLSFDYQNENDLQVLTTLLDSKDDSNSLSSFTKSVDTLMHAHIYRMMPLFVASATPESNTNLHFILDGYIKDKLKALCEYKSYSIYDCEKIPTPSLAPVGFTSFKLGKSAELKECSVFLNKSCKLDKNQVQNINSIIFELMINMPNKFSKMFVDSPSINPTTFRFQTQGVDYFAVPKLNDESFNYILCIEKEGAKVNRNLSIF